MKQPLMRVETPSRLGRLGVPHEGTSREKIPVLIFDDPQEMAVQVAKKIVRLIEEKRAVGDWAVLGLPTGSTPIGVYQELVRLHREEGVDFSNVVTFNLDEYYPMHPDSLQSYHRFMRENLFDHLNIPPEQIFIPRGDLPREAIEEHCQWYERMIRKYGGLDLVLLGIGRSGHIGFNEPGSDRSTRTRLVVLDEITRKDAASDFFGAENVPREAITMGVGTILEAREVILMATGEHKAAIIQRAVEGEVSRQVPASFLQEHPNAFVYVDAAAAAELTRVKTPWLVMEVDWDDMLAKRAVIWLSRQVDKPILHLEGADFYNHHLHALVHRYGDVDRLCLRVFEDLRSRIYYPDRLPRKKRIVVFSPHPDDDVISMGGTLRKLVENQNSVVVAYMTNGSVAVFDNDVRRHLRFMEMASEVLAMEAEVRERLRREKERIFDFFRRKRPGEVDLPEIQRLKAYIRYSEAIAALETIGLGPEAARFLDMPFYRTGQVRKLPISQADVEIVLDLLREQEPHEIFVAGDLSDPHGTHRMCYRAIMAALEVYEAAGHNRPRVWLYRGAWQEWGIEEADVFVPMSKSELEWKIEAIFKHESQKDRAMFPGAYDDREFWQRARDRNQGTARELDRLGLPAFYAVEAFVVR
jgi:glucosamine-6-phosphate deaminase|nr:MAG: glucosamine-6-phosphate deaminase [Bacteroidota bacterium]